MAQDIEDLNWSGSPLEVRFCNFPTSHSACLPSHDDFTKSTLKPLLQANPGAWIDLIGFASRLGFAAGDTAHRNLALSTARCNAVRALIRKHVPGARFNVILPEGDTESKGDARDDDGYWRAVEIRIFGATQPVAPDPVPTQPTFICGPDVTQQVIDTWTKIGNDFEVLTFIQKIKACNAILLPFKGPKDKDNPDDLEWPRDLEEWKRLAQRFAEINSWDTRPLFQGESDWLRRPPVYDSTTKGPCATPSSDILGADQADNFDPLHEDERVCSNSVQVGGKCWLAGTVNYGTFGIMVRACSNFANTDWRLIPFDTPKIVYSLTWAKMLIRAYKRFGANPEGAALPIAWTEATFHDGPKGTPSVPGNRPKCKCSCNCKGDVVDWDYVWNPHRPRPR